MATRPGSPINVYLRIFAVILADAERELDPEACAALLVILAERIRWLLAHQGSGDPWGRYERTIRRADDAHRGGDHARTRRLLAKAARDLAAVPIEVRRELHQAGRQHFEHTSDLPARLQRLRMRVFPKLSTAAPRGPVWRAVPRSREGRTTRRCRSPGRGRADPDAGEPPHGRHHDLAEGRR